MGIEDISVRGSDRDTEASDSLVDSAEPKSSAIILEALQDAERAFSPYLTYCKTVDTAYSLLGSAPVATEWEDQAFSLFWASMEILKPAIYARPPKPVASPRFKDGGELEKTVADLIERSLESTFDRAGMDDTMLGCRDDLALTNRGVAWVTYEADERGKRIVPEHLDRSDFLHEPARKWADVGWVARRAWMTRKEMRKRFKGDAHLDAQYESRADKMDEYGQMEASAKAGVWEVWSKVDNRVYWVTEGVKTILDDDEPHLNLFNFFPCPKPAYGTLKRRTLIPVPDYSRYSYHLHKINVLTGRIYVLLDQVKLKVLIPAGGDIGQAVQTALEAKDDQIVIPVPAAAFTGVTAGNLMMTLPLAEVATAIQGLIEARGQLIQDFYQLSGISDIMRGATEAQETLGAQQLKSQYGSVRVQDKVDELQRLARDVAAISSEIMAQNFDKQALLDLSRMTIPTKADIAKRIKDNKEAAGKAMEAAEEELKEAAGQGGDPQALKAAAQQKLAATMKPFQQNAEALASMVPIEDVMDMLRDAKARNLVIDIETDSTVLTDELAEKQSRSEFLGAFNAAAGSVMALMQAGEAGAKLAGGIIKFALAPYRANRELDELIDGFIEQAPQMAAMMGQGQGGEAEKALAEANQKLAEAELQKAQAAVAKVQADTAKAQQEIQLRAAEAAKKAEADDRRIVLELESTKGNIAETGARIKKIDADIELAFAKLGIERHREGREDIKTAADIQGRQEDRALATHDRQRQAFESDRQAAMGDRQQAFSERQGERADARADRQQDFAERQPAQ